MVTGYEAQEWAKARGGRVEFNEYGVGTMTFVFPQLTPNLIRDLAAASVEWFSPSWEWYARAEDGDSDMVKAAEQRKAPEQVRIVDVSVHPNEVLSLPPGSTWRED